MEPVLPLTTSSINFSSIQNTFGGSNPISLSEYYRGANPSFTSNTEGIPTSTSSSLSVSTLSNKGLGVNASTVYNPLLWIRMDELVGTPNNATISNWRGVGGLPNATGVNIGTGSTLPTYRSGDEAFPYVRLGFGSNLSTFGNYFSFGSQTLNIGTNAGFTMVCMARFWSPSAATFERVMDFGNSSPGNNIFVSRNDRTTTLVGAMYTSSFTQVNVNECIYPQWQIFIVRFTSTTMLALDLRASATGTITEALTNRTLTNCWLGRSLWSTDSFANIDFREFLFYDKPLTDTQLDNVSQMIFTKYGINATLQRGLFCRTYRGGYFNDDPNWFNTASISDSAYACLDFTSLTTASKGLETAYTGTRDLFSVQWIGFFVPQATGFHIFTTSSDDASYLWIGANATIGYSTANAVVNNGGLHGEQSRSGTVWLRAGTIYPIRIQYGDQFVGDNISVSCTVPGSVTAITDLTGYVFSTIIAVPMFGLGLWLDATTGVSVSNGSNVSQWNDMSGYERHFTQSSSSLQPTYDTSTFNSQPSLTMKSTGCVLQRNANLMGTLASGTTMTVFVVAEVASGSFWSIMFTNWFDVTRFHFSHYDTSLAGPTLYAGNAFQFRLGSSSVTSGARLLTSFNYAGLNQSSRATVNQTLVSLFNPTANLTDSSSSSTSMFNIGDSRSTYPAARIAEIIMYDRALTVAQRAPIEKYLMNKYRL